MPVCPGVVKRRMGVAAGGQGEDGGGSGWLGWPGRRRPWDSRGWANYDLFPDELYAKDLKRGALALRDFF